MKTSSIFLCLTLLIIPAISAKKSCMVVSITGDTVVLQCADTDTIQLNDRVRLHIPGEE